MYIKELKIQSYDVDNDNNLKLSSMMKYFQQVARENLDELGFTYKYLLELNIVFVLTKYKIKQLKNIHADEAVVLKTSPCEIQGVSFIRDFVIESFDGERIVEASSAWVIINFEKRAVLRPNHFPGNIPTDEKLVDFSPSRTNVPEELDFAYHTNVRYSQLDSNKHLNNCTYADIILDGICENKGNIPYISEINISYEHEALLGDSLTVNYKYDNDVCYIKCINNTSGNTCFTAIILTTPLPAF